MAAARYTRLREIGSGGFGKAFLVEDPESQRFVLKAVDLAQLDARHRRDSVNEVRVFSSLRHPFIIPYRESFLDGTTLCIIMDFAEGGDLGARISQARRAGQGFPEPKVMRWFTEVTLALKYLHERHVLHRDLKPRNLFLCSKNRLRLGDFGISKALDNTAALARTLTGTPYYLSPEICQERPYSWASDIWALGCVLYEMAALKVPFQASTLVALVTKITLGPTPALPTRYSDELRQLCGDLLKKEERARPVAGDVLRYGVLQVEIKAMLREERSSRRREEVVAAPRGLAPPAAPAASAQADGPGSGPSCDKGADASLASESQHRSLQVAAAAGA